jgi:hypothetical protein
MQQLCWKFDLATFNNDETVEDYALHLSGMRCTSPLSARR